MKPVINFSAGPSLLPDGILTRAAAGLAEYRDRGMSLLEMSHRGGDYEAVHNATITGIRRSFEVPDEFSILLLQGGATLQFAMVPMNLIAPGETGGHVVSGAWGAKAFEDAHRHADVYEAWNGAAGHYRRMPPTAEIDLSPDSRYLHVTSNETINGIQISKWPETDVPLVVDMSSDIMSRPVPWHLFDLVYAGAQKNLGPSGVTIVVIRTDALSGTNTEQASYLRYDRHHDTNSLLNTPPVFGIWLMGMIVQWIEENGGIAAMEKRANEKGALLYDEIDRSDFYTSPVDRNSRSLMNVIFRLPTEDQESRLLADAADAGLVNLKGHRSVGGLRASLYNAMPLEGVERLVSFMRTYRRAT